MTATPPATRRPFACDLGSTATYSSRRAEWVPVAPGEWRLTLTLTRGRRVERDEYAVEEQPTEYGVREFLLLNVTDEDTDVYGVAVHRGAVTSCTCTGFVAGKRHCKHADAVRGALSRGEL